MSQIVGFTFGSFGDILSILQLARTVQRLLSDSLGASSEYQDLLLELDRMLRVLHLVQGATTPRHGSGSLSINTHEDLRLSITRCRIVIFDLYARIQKFRESLRKGGSGSRMRDSWRKIGWGLFKVDELVDIRRKLKDEGDVIMTLLDVSNSMAISRVEDIVRASQANVLEIKHCIDEIPEVLGYYWEGGSMIGDRPIILNDMLGQCIQLPAQIYRTWSEFQRFLRFHYQRKAGHRFIVSGEYDLSSDHNRNSLSPTNWVVRPGTVIDMSARLRVIRFRPGANATVYIEVCPSCSRSNIQENSMKQLAEVTCSYCGSTYSVAEAKSAVPPSDIIGPRFMDGSYEDLHFGNSLSDEIESVALPYLCPSAIKIWNDRDDSRFLRRIKVIESYVEELRTLEEFSYFSNRLNVPFSTKINGQDVLDLALEEAFGCATDLKKTERHYSRLLSLLQHISCVLIGMQCFFPTKNGLPIENSHVLPPSIQLVFQQTMRIVLRFNLCAADIQRKKDEGLSPTAIIRETDELFLDTYSQLLEHHQILLLFAKFANRAQASWFHPLYRCGI
ncbi:uncharacterized protein STEHIDRAFT_163759 [Stereum hirsutum FP-91666 SS1]|uniref:Ubiquitin-like domain-containing protein n=1 Tax=Stereum hirsutum (strain FP-91666) TaxID=721885 RepID=R7RX20_STEHR|nr:uncharacterized protein STEHIDRAFT_163759 [Stereum hirsutum FP-91666 SS1]EIM79400.1 hypothetical protein STEHIDRAFT_163759 [Stereum hirsutum FP-91666 SS1]